MAFYSEIYAALKPKTRLCLRRKKWRWGLPYTYHPQPRLCRRLAKQFKISEEEARLKLLEIRAHILKYPQYF